MEKKSKDPRKKDVVIPPKKPKLTKAERRALQEKQRAAKGVKPTGDSGQKVQKTAGDPGSKQKQASGDLISGLGRHQIAPDAADIFTSKAIKLFSHLPQYKPLENVTSCGVTVKPMTKVSQAANLHPAILELGIKYADGSIRGANARCKAMMMAFKAVIRGYETPKDKTLSFDLDQKIKPIFQHLTNCRPHSVSMGNAITFIKMTIANLSRDVKEDEAKDILCEQIDEYVKERITFADEVIAEYAVSKIQNGDVILVYGRSEAVELLLYEQARKGGIDSFRVIVVDSRPLMEGRAMLERLSKRGIQCSYILLNSLSYVFKEVTKVFIGAAALMSDGSVVSRVGTAGVALMAARTCNVPVLCCCETYKISAHVQLESITRNELGNPDDLAVTADNTYGSILGDWRTTPNLKLLNIVYDLTPAEHISGIITELGILPPTSVAVILREMYPQDNNESDFR